MVDLFGGRKDLPPTRRHPEKYIRQLQLTILPQLPLSRESLYHPFYNNGHRRFARTRLLDIVGEDEDGDNGVSNTNDKELVCREDGGEIEQQQQQPPTRQHRSSTYPGMILDVYQQDDLDDADEETLLMDDDDDPEIGEGHFDDDEPSPKATLDRSYSLVEPMFLELGVVPKHTLDFAYTPVVVGRDDYYYYEASNNYNTPPPPQEQQRSQEGSMEEGRGKWNDFLGRLTAESYNKDTPHHHSEYGHDENKALVLWRPTQCASY